VLIANREALDKLSPELQARVREAVAETMPSITATMETEEEAVTRKMAADGMIVTPQKPEDVAEAEKIFASYWDEWAKTKGPDAVEALKKVRAALGR
jgi:TRAP-type C4-dicarboxylate transport system substrate-binding protein